MIRGWRGYYWNGADLRGSVEAWDGPEKIARCDVHAKCRDHEPPDEECGCGIYVVNSIDAHELHTGIRAAVVGWGKVIHYERGWRVEKCRIERLFVWESKASNQKLMDALSRYAPVEIVPDPPQMPDYEYARRPKRKPSAVGAKFEIAVGKAIAEIIGRGEHPTQANLAIAMGRSNVDKGGFSGVEWKWIRERVSATSFKAWEAYTRRYPENVARWLRAEPSAIPGHRMVEYRSVGCPKPWPLPAKDARCELPCCSAKWPDAE